MTISRWQSWRPLLFAAGLVLLTALVYAPVLRHGFVNYDDNLYVSGNPVVRQGLTWEGLRWAWTAAVACNWHPVTMLSHMLDVELYGVRPGWHHLTNLLLHLANVVLLFEVLRRMTGATWRSAAVAALFAVHPLHVESVAWISERKDVLSGLFFLLTLGAWLRYVRRPAAGRYLLALLAFALGLLAKPMLITLPFVLLLLDVWPLGRLPLAAMPAASERTERRRALRALLLEKLPFVVLAVAVSAVALYTQRGAMASLAALPLRRRAANALVSYVVYLGKSLWPSRLAVIYPLPPSIPLWKAALAAALLAALTALALARLRRAPWLAVGWLWFAGMLAPVSGLVQVGRQAMADRYTYLPSIGLFIAVVWSAHALAQAALPGELPARGPGATRRALLGAGAAVVIAALALTARVQVGAWRDSLTLFRHAAAVTDGNYVAAFHLGEELRMRGDRAEARRYYREALRIRPTLARARQRLQQMDRRPPA
jgi:tetratricopeptide (TPR) repeat protein